VSKIEKLRKRLQNQPTDFTWQELSVVMRSFGYELKTTGGSGRKFIHPGSAGTLFIHEPHPGNILKPYQVRDALDLLKQEGHL
jgi:hypothetical protein